MGAPRTLSFVVLASLAPAVARGEDASVVSVGGVCMPPETSSTEVLRILEAELAPTKVRPLEGADPPRGAHDVVLTVTDCTEAPSGARVEVWQHGETSELSVTLTDATPGARSRTFALALAESIRDVVSATGDPGFALAPIAPPRPPQEDSRTTTSAATKRDAAMSFRGGPVFRFVPKTSTPLVGAELGVAGKRFALGMTVLGTERTTSLGTADLFAVAAVASADFVELTPVWKLRANAELGVAVASGSPNAGATAHTAAAPHAALSAGIAALLPIDARWTFDGFLCAGYAGSLSADAQGRSAAALGGAFVGVDLGVRLPAEL
jgi:hypothetical protein